MAFVINPFDMLEVEIPSGKGTVKLTFPPLDCFTPEQVEKMNAEIAAVPEDTPDHLNPNKNPTALTKAMLKYFNKTKTAENAIDALVPRYVRMVSDFWSEESGISLGKSKPSTDMSSEETDQE